MKKEIVKVKVVGIEKKKLISKGKIAVKEDVYYHSVFVFDISQTNAQSKDLPQIFPNRPYNYDYSNVKNRQNLYEELVQIAKETGVDVRVAKVSEWHGVSKRSFYAI